MFQNDPRKIMDMKVLTTDDAQSPATRATTIPLSPLGLSGKNNYPKRDVCL